jgi:hypothetical protein
MLTVLLLGMTLSQAPAGSSAGVRGTAYARMPAAQKIAADPQIVAAVVARNLVPESADQIRRRDEDWKANPRFALRKQLAENDCARRLRELTGPDTFIVEAILMDHQGALVCSTVEAEDYWQGDEPKWAKTYGEGGKVFVDEPHLDVNTDKYGIQLSVLVSQGDRKIGALTLTLKVPRALARP